MSPLDRKLLRDFWRLKTQAIAVALVVACGVATVLMSFGALQSLEETRTAYYERYRFADVFAGLRRAPQWLDGRLAAVSGVSRVETRIIRDVVMDVPGIAEPASARLISLPRHGEPLLNALALRQGRLPEPNRPDEVVASANFADAMSFVPGDAVQVLMNGRKRRVVIVGTALSPEYVYALGPGQLMPDDRRFAVLWMGREALEAAFDLDGAFNDVAAALEPGTAVEAVTAEFDRILAPYGGVGAIGRKDQQSNAFLSGELNQLRAIGRIIPPIFLAVAAFLVNMVMSRLVETEREQIGLLKAFGYRDRHIAWHYLKLVMGVSLLGLALGVGFGTWFGRGLTELYTQFYRFPLLLYRPQPWLFVAAAGVALGAAAAGAGAAVLRAAALAPAVAMQPAPPVVYSSPLLLRFRLRLPISPPTLMILRHIVRWPLRAALTTLGVAMSVALLITSMFSFDSIDHIIDVFYFRTQHQDLTVTFTEPVEARVLHDLRHLPGVVAVEGVRSVPVRLRNGPLMRLASVRGVENGAALTSLLDAELRPVVVPEKGLVLTDKLARLLDVSPGDMVTVEALQGRRPVLSVPVAAVVAEYIGTAAYAHADALNAWMREGPVVSGAHVVVDPAQASAFMAALKNTPAVAGMTSRELALRSFRGTAAETMTTVVSFYVAFASVIAFGVIYNSARIALSERGRELATLRVLGFTRSEVIYILLGELALLTTLALPLGCLIGRGMAGVVASGLDTELFRVPLVITAETYGIAMLAIAVAAAISAVVVARRVAHLDLVAVLKTRE